MILKQKRKILFLLIFLLMGFTYDAYGQKFAFRTNALTWATLSPNIGAEAILNSHVSINVHVTYRPFDFKSDPMRVLVFQPEVRYWLGRPHARHYFGVTAFYEDNFITYKDNYYRGDGFAAGVTYGYSWVLSDHWNIEASIGVGAMYTRQFKYPKGDLMPPEVNYKKWLPVPMKCAISFVYILR